MVDPVNNSTPMDKLPEEEIGARIRSARERQGLSQTQLHQRTKDVDPEGKGVGRTVLVGYEAGKFKPGARELRVLAAALSLPVEWILLGKTTEATTKEAPDEDDFDSVKARLLGGMGDPRLADVFRLALALAALKPHERESIGVLVHGLMSARKGMPAADALTDLAEQMALDAELRLAELTDSFEAADNLLTFKGKRLFEHFAALYEKAYRGKFWHNRNRKISD